MKQEPFEIKTYGKSELAMMYFPKATSKESALRSLNNWFRINDRLKHLINAKIKNYSPKQVRLIVSELGEPSDY